MIVRRDKNNDDDDQNQNNDKNMNNNDKDHKNTERNTSTISTGSTMTTPMQPQPSRSSPTRMIAKMRDLAMDRWHRQQQEAQQQNQEQHEQEQEEKDALLLLPKYWESLWQDGITAWDLGHATPALRQELWHSGSLLEQWYHRHGQQQRQRQQDDIDDNNNKYIEFRVLVPGCGAGYDLWTLAEWFWTRQQQQPQSQSNHHHRTVVITGVDLSPTSLQRAIHYLKDKQQQQQQQHYNNDVTVRIDVVLGDFFQPTSTWQVQESFCLGGGTSSFHSSSSSNNNNKNPTTMTNSDSLTTSTTKEQGQSRPLQPFYCEDVSSFQFCFDYTFFCALPPELRSEWGQRITQLLVQDKDDEDSKNNKNAINPEDDSHGLLLTFIFPILPPHKKQADTTLINRGPPFPVTVEAYQDCLMKMNGWSMAPGSPHVNPDTVPSRQGMELVAWWVRPPNKAG